MRRGLFLGIGLSILAVAPARAQVSCAGVPAFATCTAYASGASVVFNNTKYTAIAPISATRDCPPNSPFNPSTDNWWTSNGTCTATGTATSTAAATSTATATRTATATATRTPTATSTGATATATTGATATNTATATATRTSTATATATIPGTGCSPAWSASTQYNGGAQVSRACSGSTQNFQAAFWTQGNDPCTSNGAAGSGQPWTPKGACVGTGTATATATTATATATTGTPTATRTATVTATATRPTVTPTSCGSSCTGGNTITGYFAQWGIYDTTNPYYPKNIETSGTATKINVINYAFNNVVNNKCETGVTQAGRGDAYADYGMGYEAAQSVDGVADVWEQKLKGNYNQLKKLKARNPNLKVVMSLGGWTWSDGFYTAASSANRAAFVTSCIDAYIKGNLANDAGDNAGGAGVAAGIFDGIDLDWEYPGVCGNNAACKASAADRANLSALAQEFRRQLDAAKPGLLLTAAVAAGSDKITQYDTASLGASLDRINIMTYDFFGAWDAQGPTSFHSPLNAWTGMPASGRDAGYWSSHAVDLWKAGAPASKIYLGIGFYGRGWTGVSNANNGLNQPATGPAPAPDEPGYLNYRILAPRNAPSFISTEAGTQWTYNGAEFWSFDTPSTIATKMSYVRSQGLGGAFLWSFEGDSDAGTLVTAMRNNLP